MPLVGLFVIGVIQDYRTLSIQTSGTYFLDVYVSQVMVSQTATLTINGSIPLIKFSMPRNVTRRAVNISNLLVGQQLFFSSTATYVSVSDTTTFAFTGFLSFLTDYHQWPRH